MRNLPESRHRHAPKLRETSKTTASMRSATARERTRHTALFTRRANGIKRSTTILTLAPERQMPSEPPFATRVPRAPARLVRPAAPLPRRCPSVPVTASRPYAVRSRPYAVQHPSYTAPPRQPTLSVNPKFPAVTDRAARTSGTTRERSAPGPGSRSVSASRSESYGAAGRASRAGCCRAAMVGAPRYGNATGRPAKGRERHPTRARAAAPPSAPTARVPSWAPPHAPPHHVRRPCALPCAEDFPYGCPPHRRPARDRRRAVRPNPRAWAVPRRSRPCSRSATRSGRTRRPRRRRAGSGPVR